MGSERIGSSAEPGGTAGLGSRVTAPVVVGAVPGRGSRGGEGVGTDGVLRAHAGVRVRGVAADGGVADAADRGAEDRAGGYGRGAEQGGAVDGVLRGGADVHPGGSFREAGGGGVK